MLYRWISLVVIFAHFIVLVFVSVGALLILRWRRVMWVHLPFVLWGLVLEYFGFACWLTPFEKWSLIRAGLPTYDGPFIDHYVTDRWYPDGLTDTARWTLASVVLVTNVGIYSWIAWRAYQRAARARAVKRAESLQLDDAP